MTTDERASINAVIEQERRTVEHYGELLKQPASKAQRTRYRALRRKHVLYIKRWREELTDDA